VNAQYHLLDGVRDFAPASRDLILLGDVDEIPIRGAIATVRRNPPVHYYNLGDCLVNHSYL
jgi:hypothetical protein